MPTGYTAAIHDGKDVSLKDFATSCARGMGFFLHMRDERSDAPLSYPPKSWTESIYERRSLEDAISALHKWRDMDEEAKYAEWSEYVREQDNARAEAMRKNTELRLRYLTMLAEVTAVEVPAKLESFKDFMISQLEESIKFDCGDSDKFERDYYKTLDYSAWCDMRARTVSRDIEYYTEAAKTREKRNAELLEYLTLFSETFDVELVKP